MTSERVNQATTTIDKRDLPGTRKLAAAWLTAW